MSTILPESEALRRAVKWISERVNETPGTRPQHYLAEAINKFDLSPKDADFLINFYRDSS